MIYNATIQWNDNGNIEDDKLIVVGIPEELVMGTFMDDQIFFYCEDEDDWESFKIREGEDWRVLSSSIDVGESLLLLKMLTSDLRHYKIDCINLEKKFHTEDADGNEITKELDYEEMANDFENKLSKFDGNVVVMCSIETRGTIN
tara:strand:+ start:3581 stop:4015 length:435 start_codon:yes stop_codon:yes gene_type:complete